VGVGTHAAVWLPTAVALLSFATDVANISATTVSPRLLGEEGQNRPTDDD